MNQNLENLHLMSFHELQGLRAQITTLLTMKRPAFKVGMKWEVNSPKVAGIVGEIVKVNRLKCKIKLNGQTWNVPKDMIELV